MSFYQRLEEFKGDESEAAFARRLGVALNTLRGWRIGDGIVDPRSKTVIRIATKLGCEPGYLLYGRVQ